MDGKLSPAKEREWIAIAARAVAELLEELALTSCRKAAFRLKVNARTLSKLNPDHPGTGLKPETLDKILYRIEETFRYEKFDEQEINSMMSKARNEISRAFYGPFVPRY